jgi:hypothetical protein
VLDLQEKNKLLIYIYIYKIKWNTNPTTFRVFQNIHGKKNIHSEYFVFPMRKEKKSMWVDAGGEDGLGNGVSDGGVTGTWVVGVGGG